MNDDTEKKRELARSKMDAALRNATEAEEAARVADRAASEARNRRDRATQIYDAARAEYVALLPERDGYGCLRMPSKARA